MGAINNNNKKNIKRKATEEEAELHIKAIPAEKSLRLFGVRH